MDLYVIALQPDIYLWRMCIVRKVAAAGSSRATAANTITARVVLILQQGSTAPSDPPRDEPLTPVA